MAAAFRIGDVGRLGIAGLGVLLVALASMMPLNEYRAMGMDAVDCDGPLRVLLVAVPGLVVCVLGLVCNRGQRVVSAVCALACVGLMPVLWGAVAADARQTNACEAR